MMLEQWSYIATIVQVPLVVVTLGVIWFQLRQATTLARAEHAQNTVAHASAFNLALAQDRDLARLWTSRGHGLTDPLDEARYGELLVQWLILHEMLFFQKEKRLIDDDLYAAWARDLKRTLAVHNVGLAAKDLADVFAPKFAAHASMLQRAGAPITPTPPA